MHAHKIKDITSKTIRANARLFQKYKTENLPEAGLLEILSQQVMQNLEKQHSDANAFEIKQEASEKLSNNQMVAGPSSSVVNKEQSSNCVIPDGLDVAKNVNCAIKVENSIDTTASNDSITANMRCNNVQIKQEEVSDAYSENVPSVNNVIPPDITKVKKEDRLSTHKNQRTLQQSNIEKVFIDEQQSTELKIKAEVVIKDCLGESYRDNFVKTDSTQLSEQTNRTPSSPSPENPIVRAPTDKSTKQERNSTFKCDRCPSSFRQKIKLKVHLKSHSITAATDKVKMCEICGKTYTQSSALQKHLKFAHSNFRPFPCEICGRAFKDSNGLKVSIGAQWFVY